MPTESWFDPLPEERKKALRRSPRSGLLSISVTFVLALALSGYVLYEIAKLLRG